MLILRKPLEKAGVVYQKIIPHFAAYGNVNDRQSGKMRFPADHVRLA